MKLETGEPIMDGRYVVYVEGLLGWLEPHIVVRAGKKWKFQGSSQDYPDAVHCWIGPLPVMSKEAWSSRNTNFAHVGPTSFSVPPREFDL
jgi:hypothetical protein